MKESKNERKTLYILEKSIVMYILLLILFLLRLSITCGL